jgi:chromosome segregation ATPase
MELETAIDVIESVSGFDDESTSVGEAWQTILNHLNPHIGSSFDSYLLEECQQENRELREAIRQGKSLLIQAKGEIKLHKDNFRALKAEYEPERARRATEKKRRQKLRRKIDRLKEENRNLKELLQTIVDEEWLNGSPIEEVARKALSNT